MLDTMGIKAAVISNWDYSLHRVLKMFGIYERFVVVKASLEEGVEKPDPRLFQITLQEAGFSPHETFHVGDDLVDDVEGANRFGIRSTLIDRSLAKTERPVICTLADLPEAFGWID
jgi:putative hydrolase of the HAD superfamily